MYRKPTHTDQYLAYYSHHPQSVKHGIVKCLYDRAKHLITKPSVISKEKKHLSSVLVSNGYPSSFIQKLTKTTRPTANSKPTQEFKSTAVLPYIKGVSEVHTKTYIHCKATFIYTIFVTEILYILYLCSRLIRYSY